MTSKFVVLIAVINLVAMNSLVTHEPFLQHEIVPDVLTSPPESVLKVTFPNGIEVELGNELSVSQVVGVPAVEWNHRTDGYYTLIFCDADAPSRANPEARSFLHWLVVNIPGHDVTSGSTLTNILNSHPEPDTGLHRYMFLVYEQPSVIDFEEKPDDSFERRFGFSPEDFAAKYELGVADAGNFYQTENHENVANSSNERISAI